MIENVRIERRSLMLALGLGVGASLSAGRAMGQALAGRGPVLPSPVFPATPDTVRIATRTGLRPVRTGGYLLEAATVGSKSVIHNYGHGGAGITMSWGCAEEVARLAGAFRATLPSLDVAVLGGGVMGMTAAMLLIEQGFRVTLYSADFTPDTTSDVAGGQWAPSVVEFTDAARHQRMLQAAFSRFTGYGRRYGVSRRDNYSHFRSEDLDHATAASGLGFERLDLLPFQRIYSGGYRYPTLLVEPPIFLRRLHADLRERGALFVRRRLNSASELEQMVEPLVVNCLGLGAREVWSDRNLSGRKGVLAMLPPQQNLRYLYSGIGYMFPRQDHLVVGGSLEAENEIDTSLTDVDKARLILKIVRAVFQGAIPAPNWISGSRRLRGADMIRSAEQPAPATSSASAPD